MQCRRKLFTRKRVWQSLLPALLSLAAQSALCADRYLLRAPAAAVSGIAERHSLQVTGGTNAEGISLVLTSDTRTAPQVVAELQADPEVEDIEWDRSIKIPETSGGLQPSLSIQSVQNALAGQNLVPYYGVNVRYSYVNQSATSLMHLSEARGFSVTGSGVVAVIDTGIDPAQPVLQQSLVPGYDFVRNTAGIPSEWSDLDPATAATLSQAAAGNAAVQLGQSTAVILDQSTAVILDTTRVPAAFGHGTMVAGIVHLVAPAARIMPLKVFSSDGSASLADIVRAVYFAVDNGAQVINMSFSLPGFSFELMRALNYAAIHNVVCVASVGNGGSETIAYPASFHNVLGIASTDAQDQRSAFTNYGAALTHMAAPGEGIITTYPGGSYAVVSGTSFAAPFVSGGVALILQTGHDATPSEVEQALSNSKHLTPDLGCGRLDLYLALMSMQKQ